MIIGIFVVVLNSAEAQQRRLIVENQIDHGLSQSFRLSQCQGLILHEVFADFLNHRYGPKIDLLGLLSSKLFINRNGLEGFHGDRGNVFLHQLVHQWMSVILISRFITDEKTQEALEILRGNALRKTHFPDLSFFQFFHDKFDGLIVISPYPYPLFVYEDGIR